MAEAWRNRAERQVVVNAEDTIVGHKDQTCVTHTKPSPTRGAGPNHAGGYGLVSIYFILNYMLNERKKTKKTQRGLP